jgi:rubredoxin
MKPIPMRLNCPECGELHIDEGRFVTKVHHTHACQHCGAVWRPAVVPTVGVRFLPGFKNEPSKVATVIPIRRRRAKLRKAV